MQDTTTLDAREGVFTLPPDEAAHVDYLAESLGIGSNQFLGIAVRLAANALAMPSALPAASLVSG